MVLFDQGVEVLALSQFAGSGKDPLFFHILEGYGVRGVCIDGNHAGCEDMRRIERFREKAFGCPYIP